jgi:hypothetical protein
LTTASSATETTRPSRWLQTPRQQRTERARQSEPPNSPSASRPASAYPRLATPPYLLFGLRNHTVIETDRCCYVQCKQWLIASESNLQYFRAVSFKLSLIQLEQSSLR